MKMEGIMKLHRLFKIFVMGLLIMAPRIVLAENLVFIVNAENSVSDLSPQEVKKYMLKEAISWPNGQKVRSVDRKGSPPERMVYLKDVIHKNTDQLDKYWVGQRYKSGVPIPPKLGSDAQVIEYVQSFAGALGYVSAGSINGTDGSTIKIVGTFPMK